MRKFAILFFGLSLLTLASCGSELTVTTGDDPDGDPDANLVGPDASDDPSDMRGGSEDSGMASDMDGPVDMGTSSGDMDSTSDMPAAADTGDPVDMGSAADMVSVDMSSSPDVGMDMGADTGGSDAGADAGVDMNTCVDADNDGWFVDCASYDTVDGPDCNDNDVDNWVSCATCADNDSDTYFAGCDAYTTRNGPDCSDSDVDNWNSCASCVDGDSDGYYVGCDAYTLINGPDCSDSDIDNWASCATCVDADMDMTWVGCDQYVMRTGPDCADMDAMRYPGNTEIMGNGIDDDCDSTTPDMVTSCTYTPTPATNPESGALAGITAAHNEWRWRVGTAPLVWNTTLAAASQVWADNCQFSHSSQSQRQTGSGFSSVGENLYVSSGQVTNQRVLNGVQLWADERVDYDYGTAINSTNYMIFGHYTQIVWKNSTDVGCGAAYCPNLLGGGTLVVCRYGPSGNFLGQTPYDFTTASCVDLDNDDVWQFQDADDTDRTVQ